MTGKRALVSGAAGFVGANLVRRLLADGHEVHTLDRPGGSGWRLAEIRGDLVGHEADVRDADAVSGAVRSARPDWIFHLAAHGAYSWQTDVRRMVEANLLGTVNLLEAGAEVGFEAFVQAGSSSEYGFRAGAPSEGDALEPNSDYAATKAAATLWASSAARRRGLNVATLRLYSAYGPFEEPPRLIPALIVHGLRGELPPLVDPATARDFVFVDDVCDAFVLAVASNDEPGAVYNVGSGVQTTVADAVAVAQRVLGFEAEPVWETLPARGWDTTVWVADRRRSQRYLGWTPQHGFEDGFRRTAEWLQSSSALVEVYEPALVDT